MSTPSKRRKLNDSAKASPASASRNLDFFFGKQTGKQNTSAILASASESPSEHANNDSDLTDEQLARKLQEEWDQEDRGHDERVKPPATAGKEAINGERQVEIGGDSQADIYADILTTNVIGMPGASSKAGATPESEKQTEAHSAIHAVTRLQPNSKKTLSLQSAGSAEDTITSSIPFDESPLIFEPSKYVADLQSHWSAEGGSASYALLTRCFVLVNSTQSRIKIVDTLVNLLRVIIEGDSSSLLPTVRTIYCCFRAYSGLVTCH